MAQSAFLTTIQSLALCFFCVNLTQSGLARRLLTSKLDVLHCASVPTKDLRSGRRWTVAMRLSVDDPKSRISFTLRRVQSTSLLSSISCSVVWEEAKPNNSNSQHHTQLTRLVLAWCKAITSQEFIQMVIEQTQAPTKTQTHYSTPLPIKNKKTMLMLLMK